MSVLSDRMCRAHKRAKPCASCVSASVAQKRRWTAEARYKAHLDAMATRDEAYCEEEIELIRSCAGRMAAADIAVAVSKIRMHYGLSPRTKGSVHAWAERNGVSLFMDGSYSLDVVRRMLGVSSVTLEVWRERGWLTGRSWAKFWVYEDAELHRFVADYPWLLDDHRIAVASLRTTHAMANRRDPWLRARHLSKLVPMSTETLIDYLHRGYVPYHQRTGHNGAYMVQASSVPLIRDLLVVGNTHHHKMTEAA